ncbi:hypothetical protein DVH24_021933 [Malus domestica]|uniref:Terpene synthase metal-binding domain-containing protein n=1 Tax=Malus domestica TaxID=3750 RepID=A0A498ITZ8_MALDO|nr:hypothetical protein DVH24_021933 [Malus domestica]
MGLLNDIQGFKRESAEGKLNVVSLAMIHCNGVTRKEAINEMKNVIVIKIRELLRLALLEKGTPDMMKTENAIMEEPIFFSETVTFGMCNRTTIWMKEADFFRNKSVATMEEYMTNGYVSSGIRQAVPPALYLVGP